jgi:tripartite-type tricarboxylate transporter receptor subunit TctC
LRRCFVRILIAGLFALLGAASPSARAQDIAQFYTGKTINLIVGAGSGGSFEVYARALANHMSKHIPGHPTIVVKIAGGVGGGVGTAIQIEHSVPKDGTTFGITQETNVTGQLTEPEVAGKYDVSKWSWIGNMASLRNVLAVWYTAPAQTLEEAKQKQVIVGSVGRNSPTFTVPQALNILIGTKFKMVLGYNGVNDLNLAMERGEIQARGGSWISIVTLAPQYISEKKIKPLAVDGLTRDPLIPDVPTLLELAPTENQKAAERLISGADAFARAFFLLPGVPPERVAALRQAFNETMKDPELLDEAKKLGIPIEPQVGEELDKIAAQIVASPPDAIALAKQLLGSD